MKPLYPNLPNLPNAPSAKADVADEAHVRVSHALWQLLSGLPGIELEGLRNVADMNELQALAAPAAPGGAGGPQGDTRERAERDRDTTATLTAAAHLLATTIQQLGTTRYAHADDAAQQLPAPDLPWTMRLVDVDATGGTASVNVLHPLLGDIALDVELTQGSAHVSATVANEHGAQILLEGQAALAERLLRQGITLVTLDVIVRRKRRGKKEQPARKRARKEER